MHTTPAANHTVGGGGTVSCAVRVAVLLSLLLPSSLANGAWSHFDMVRADAQGDYLWSYPENWSGGVPNAGTSIEIGDDSSRRAIHCVLKIPNAACAEVQIAEHGLTDGSSLTVKPGAMLTTNYWTQVGKDEWGVLIVEGTVRVAGGVELSLGGVWELGGGLAVIRPGGLLEATGRVSLNKSRGKAATTSDSRIEVYGTFSSGNGMDISSNDPYLPGSVWIGGNGRYTNLGGAVNVEVGSLEVEGGSASVSTQSLRFYGADTVLKLSGDGISTIDATAVTFDAGTLLDVRHLNVPDGTHTVIDGTSMTDNGLAFAPGTDTGVWSFQVVGGDLRLTVDSGGLPINAAPMAVDDWYGAAENTPLAVMAAAGVLANDTDPNPDTLNAVLVAGPSHAAAFTLSADGSFIYMPAAGWSGLETFTYKANDGRMDSPLVGTVRIVVDSAAAGPAGYWKLDDGTGITATDSSGNGNHGTLRGATWTDGRFDGATQFDGFGDVISISDRGSNWELDLRDGLTIALWVYPDLISSTRRLVSKDNAYEFQAIRASGSKYSLRLNNQQLAVSMTELKEVRWQHVAATWDQASGTVRYYYNGRPDGTASFAGPLAMNNTGIGFAGRPSGAYAFAGRLDEVRIYRRALSPAEIAVLATMVPPNYAPTAVDDPDYVVLPGGTLLVNAAAGVLANDFDPDAGDTLTAELATGPTQAQSFSLNADGSFVYVPAAGFEGVDYFTYRAFDGNAYSPTAARATITVSAPPIATGWYAVADHGAAGEASLEIGDDGSFCEPRSSGIAKLQVEFSSPFDEATLLADSVVIAGLDAANQPVDLTGIIVDTLAVGGSMAEITFTPPLPDYCRYRVRVEGLQDTLGRYIVAGVERILIALVGDVSGDLRVNATDFSRVRAARTKLVDAGSADQVRADVSCDGRVNAADLSRIRARRPRDASGIPDPQIAP